MKNLPLEVREKAIEIANALYFEKNMEEGIMIATAISRAKDWTANRGLPTEKQSAVKKRRTDIKKHGEDRYVIPDGNANWAVKEEGTKEVEKVFRSKKSAIDLAKKEAKKAHASVTIQKRTGKVQTRISFTPHRKKKNNLNHRAS